MGVSVTEGTGVRLVGEPELMIWPGPEGYLDIWRQHEVVVAKAQGSQIEIDDDLNSDIIEGRTILGGLGLDGSRPTAAFHIRSTQAFNRSLRNSSIMKYFETFDSLICSGYNVVLLGSVTAQDVRNLPRGVIRVSNIAGKRENSLANLSTWHDCEFFVGNASGGTFPASAFEKRTLWVDQLPLSLLRAPGPMDLVVPKLIFKRSSLQPLSLQELFSEEHKYSQTESPVMLQRAGYCVRSVSSEEVRLAVTEMVEMSSSDTFEPTSGQANVDRVYKENGFQQGGYVADSFLKAWEPFLA